VRELLSEFFGLFSTCTSTFKFAVLYIYISPWWCYYYAVVDLSELLVKGTCVYVYTLCMIEWYEVGRGNYCRVDCPIIYLSYDNRIHTIKTEKKSQVVLLYMISER
jgi:hypothetical protein